LLGMNDDAVCLLNRSVCIAGKHRSHNRPCSPVGAGLARDER